MRVLAILMTVLALGCGGAPSDPKDYGDADKLSLILSDLEDARGERHGRMFAGGVTPPEREHLGRFEYRFKGKPAVTGDSATATVVFTADGTPAGEKTWTFVKEGGTWKVKDAPLP